MIIFRNFQWKDSIIVRLDGSKWEWLIFTDRVVAVMMMGGWSGNSRRIQLWIIKQLPLLHWIRISTLLHSILFQARVRKGIARKDERLTMISKCGVRSISMLKLFQGDESLKFFEHEHDAWASNFEPLAVPEVWFEGGVLRVHAYLKRAFCNRFVPLRFATCMRTHWSARFRFTVNVLSKCSSSLFARRSSICSFLEHWCRHSDA